MDKLNGIKASIKARYQYEIGDSGAILVAVLEEGHCQNYDTIKQAVERINQSQQSFQTDKPTVAFWYGVGRGGLWVLPILVMIGLGTWFYQQQQDAKQIAQLLAKYPNADNFQYLMQGSQLEKTRDGTVYLVLKPAPKEGSIQAGKHYIYNKQCNCIQVPLLYRGW